MENTFVNFMEKSGNITLSENGAIMFRTTNKPLLDCNFAVSNWRDASEETIISNFSQAYNDDPISAITWLFFLRDCRGGLGERRSFRICMKWISDNESDLLNFLEVVKYIPEFGRWDDLIDLAFTTQDRECSDECFDIIENQFIHDISNVRQGLTDVSLLAKWMPSVNTSNQETIRRGKFLAKRFNISEMEYRKGLSMLRKYLKIVECDMSANRWSEIEYDKVPAKAGIIYANAFMKHDEKRRVNYISDVLLGNAKSNIGGLNPYEVWHKAIYEYGNITGNLYKTVWNKLVEQGFQETDAFDGCIPVVDTSGSMSDRINNTITIRDIAFSLGTYFSQKSKGPFRNKVITFSEYPSWIDINNCRDPYEVNRQLLRGSWGMNTNIEATFDLILKAAINENVTQEDMPKSLLIISDMQFDRCVNECYSIESTSHLFDSIADKWHLNGYELPKLIFWSLDTTHHSRITVPMIDCGDNGVTLISGYSQNATKVGASEKKDPMDALLEVLNSERYEVIRKALS